MVNISMKPNDGSIDLKHTALLIIDMQRDFLQPGGFGEMLGNDISTLQTAIEPCKKVLEAARAAGVLVMHTKEGHRADMTDVHKHKNEKKNAEGKIVKSIGETGPMGRILIRGEPGHDIIPELYPIPGEPVIDKPGKGAFYSTDLELILAVNKITTLLVCGVTTEVCVHTTVREANDRGFHCIVISDACASFFDHFHTTALDMISAQRGIFGSVTDSKAAVAALQSTS
jgi:nicotinamidase-related amidase